MDMLVVSPFLSHYFVGNTFLRSIFQLVLHPKILNTAVTLRSSEMCRFLSFKKQRKINYEILDRNDINALCCLTQTSLDFDFTKPRNKHFIICF